MGKRLAGTDRHRYGFYLERVGGHHQDRHKVHHFAYDAWP